MIKQERVQELSIKVTIAERQYPLKIQASDEENVRKAAWKVNERLKEYVEKYAVADRQDALAMIALEFATEYFSELQKGAGLDPAAKNLIERLEASIDQALKTTQG
ncbi:MAG: cell division protein ZapA [Bacteroidota bacterium]|nr:cell division protein ZapA [Bacteroidota bacterium]MDX5431692.1 cell division protein ZapA [Bacteroidota bacterium]MDX5470407.1 cell division protein ZapA [Bacteroidota bacterium]